MKAGIKILSCLGLALTVFACQPTVDFTPAAAPEYHEGDIIILDMTRWREVTSRDSIGVVRLWETMHLTSTLQGIVNRDAPRLYLRYLSTGGIEVDDFWWDKCIGEGKWLAGRKVITMYDPVKVLDIFKDRVKGLVVYDPAVASTSNVASWRERLVERRMT